MAWSGLSPFLKVLAFSTQRHVLSAVVLSHVPLALNGASRVLPTALVFGDIAGFFTNLYGQITIFALAESTFFFAWAAILYGASGVTGNERAKTYAQGALYAALVGLALAALAGTIAGVVNTAAQGE
jgi:hypothetical protein